MFDWTCRKRSPKDYDWRSRDVKEYRTGKTGRKDSLSVFLLFPSCGSSVTTCVLFPVFRVAIVELRVLVPKACF